jgi:hypothetical protein
MKQPTNSHEELFLTVLTRMVTREWSTSGTSAFRREHCVMNEEKDTPVMLKTIPLQADPSPTGGC